MIVGGYQRKQPFERSFDLLNNDPEANDFGLSSPHWLLHDFKRQHETKTPGVLCQNKSFHASIVGSDK